VSAPLAAPAAAAAVAETAAVATARVVSSSTMIMMIIIIIMVADWHSIAKSSERKTEASLRTKQCVSPFYNEVFSTLLRGKFHGKETNSSRKETEQKPNGKRKETGNRKAEPGNVSVIGWRDSRYGSSRVSPKISNVKDYFSRGSLSSFYITLL
jgi:hypothetical protein